MPREMIRPANFSEGSVRVSGYELPLAATCSSTAFSFSERLDPVRMQQALALVLSDYGEFAGRLALRRGDVYIDHSMDGVSFELAQSSERCTPLLVSLRHQHSKLLCPRLPWLRGLLGMAPLLAVRLTQTVDGCVLGLTWNHLVGDAQSLSMLLRAWSAAYSGQPYERPLALADREAYLLEHAGCERPATDGWRIMSWSELLRAWKQNLHLPGRVRRVVFDVSWRELADVHAEIAAIHPSVTINDVLSAHLLLTLDRLLPARLRPRMVIAVNCRSRLGLPNNLIGNFADVTVIDARTGDDLASTALRLRTQVKNYNASSVSALGWPAFHDCYPGAVNRMRFWWGPGDPGAPQLIATNLLQSGYYDVRFGEGRTTFVFSRSTEVPLVGACMILRSPDDTGLYVELALPGELAERFEREVATPPSFGLPRGARFDARQTCAHEFDCPAADRS